MLSGGGPVMSGAAPLARARAGSMIVDLMIIGLGARVILGAVTRGRQRRQSPGTGTTQSSS
jgi:hypothetical protein